jgi:hypothetical protein
MIGTEMSVRNYHYTLRNNPEERVSHLLGGGSLKSGKISWLYRSKISAADWLE